MWSGRLLATAALLVALIASCGGSNGKPCKNGTDVAGNACTANSNCNITCVCERSGSKFRETAGLCRPNRTCQGAEATCIESCLILAATYTGNFCNP